MEQKNEKPEWVKAAEKWQEENNKARSIIIIASDKEGMTNMIVGMPLVLINSILQNIQQNPIIAQYIKDAQAIATGGIAEHLFSKSFSEYAKEHDIEVENIDPLERLHDLLGDILNKRNE